ncbi:hypothetical protein L484_011269 [Morus notabilis]|uniref:Uncharacterized protein n=1 Tax=Morus notabilis TaxID=981085 RepID=W9S1I6_9ROSA|nr:hypothetical protein L484_011269 [Morus notabilis]
MSHDLQFCRNQPQFPAEVLKTTKASDRDISSVRHPIMVIPVPMDSEQRDEKNPSFFTARFWPEHNRPWWPEFPPQLPPFTYFPTVVFDTVSVNGLREER